MIQESLSNIKMLQIYGAENRNTSRFSRLHNQFIKIYKKEIRFRITREQIDAYIQFLLFDLKK